MFKGKNIVLFGPESSGKTTLCNALAKSFNGLWVPEYLRTFCETKERLPLPQDMPEIFHGQKMSELSFQQQNPAWLFLDTNPLQLMLYHEFYFGNCPSDETACFFPSGYHLYLLCKPDLAWESDPLRDMPERREELFNLFKARLERRALPYRIISGTGTARTQCAINEIKLFFKDQALFQR